jgi:hypothetical protein
MSLILLEYDVWGMVTSSWLIRVNYPGVVFMEPEAQILLLSATAV